MSAALAPIADRVHAVLTDEAATSGAVSETLASLRNAISDINADVGRARDKALDPLSAPSVADKARADMEKLSFEGDRLKAAERALEARVTRLQAAEARSARRAAYEAAKAERDALAAEIADRWPKLQAEVVSLLTRLKASDAQLDATRDGGEWLASAEAVARGCDANFMDRSSHVKRLASTTFVKFEPRQTTLDYGCAWPTRTGHFG